MSQNPVYNDSLRTAEHGFAPAGAQRRATATTVTRGEVMGHAAVLFAVVLVTAAIGWAGSAAVPGLSTFFWLGGMIGTLIIGFLISRMRTVKVGLIVAYSVVEGFFLGSISQSWNTAYSAPDASPFNGVVAQAVLATLATFLGMYIADGLGLLKVGSTIRRIISIASFGYGIFAIINFIYAVIARQPFGIGGSTTLGIIISILATILAAGSLALDFNSIDHAVERGAPKQYAWLLAHGLIVSLIWLYNEFLRLIARSRRSASRR